MSGAVVLIEPCGGQAPPPAGDGAWPRWLAVLDLRPGGGPLRVRDAGGAPVIPAVGERRLPVGDALEVRRVRHVVVGAVVRDFLVEDRAGLRVGRRRPERVGGLG